MIMINFRLNPDFDDWPNLDALLREAYAPMMGRIDPPSFLTTMTLADIAQKAHDEDFFLTRDSIDVTRELQ